MKTETSFHSSSTAEPDTVFTSAQEFLRSLKHVHFYVSEKNDEPAVACLVTDSTDAVVDLFKFSLSDFSTSCSNNDSTPKNTIFFERLDTLLNSLTADEKTRFNQFFPEQTVDSQFNLLLAMSELSLENTLKLIKNHLTIQNVRLLNRADENAIISFEHTLDGAVQKFRLTMIGLSYLFLETFDEEKVDFFKLFILPIEKKLSVDFPDISLLQFFDKHSRLPQRVLRKLVVEELLVSKAYRLLTQFNPTAGLPINIIKIASFSLI